MIELLKKLKKDGIEVTVNSKEGLESIFKDIAIDTEYFHFNLSQIGSIEYEVNDINDTLEMLRREDITGIVNYCNLEIEVPFKYYSCLKIKNIQYVKYQQDGITVKVNVREKKENSLDLTGKIFKEKLWAIMDKTDLLSKPGTIYLGEKKVKFNRVLLRAWCTPHPKILSCGEIQEWYKLSDISSITFHNGFTVVNEDEKNKSPIEKFLPKLKEIGKPFSIFHKKYGYIVNCFVENTIGNNCICFKKVTKEGKIIVENDDILSITYFDDNENQIILYSTGIQEITAKKSDKYAIIRNYLNYLKEENIFCNIKTNDLYKKVIIHDVKEDRFEFIPNAGYLSILLSNDISKIKSISYVDKGDIQVNVNVKE